MIGATLGAIAAFYLARHLLHGWVSRRFGHHRLFQRLNQIAQQDALASVLMVRFAPISPFNVVNFLFGLTAVPLRPYAIGTLVGIIPGTAVYTWLGVTGRQAMQGQGVGPLLLCLGALAVLSAVPIVWRRA